jgi:hypothetical protein
MTICWARINEVTARICSTAPQRRPHCREASSIGSNGNGFFLAMHETLTATASTALRMAANTDRDFPALGTESPDEQLIAVRFHWHARQARRHRLADVWL